MLEEINPQAVNADPIELLLQKCWSPPCPNIAAFRDGMGWWYCYEHRERGQWGVDKVPNYDEFLLKVRKLCQKNNS